MVGTRVGGLKEEEAPEQAKKSEELLSNGALLVLDTVPGSEERGETDPWPQGVDGLLFYFVSKDTKLPKEKYRALVIFLSLSSNTAHGTKYELSG